MAVAEMTETAAPTSNGTTKVPLTPLRFEGEKHTITTSLPAQVRDQLKSDAAKRDITDNAMVRKILGMYYGFDVVDPQAKARPGKYAGLTKEQKSAARAAENSVKKDRMEKILAGISNGVIPRDILAQLGIVLD